MRVLAVSHSAARRSARLRYCALDKSNFKVSILAPNRWYEFGKWIPIDKCENECTDVKFKSIRFPRAGAASWYLHYYPHYFDIIKGIAPDVIHLWEEPWSIIAAHTVYLRNKYYPNIKIVLEVDQNILKKLPFPFENIRKYVLNNTNFVLSRSSDADKVIRKCGYTGLSDYIGYGVERGIFNTNDRNNARSYFGFEKFTVGYAGRLVVEKGLDDVLAAFTQIKSDAQLAIMGWGPHEEHLKREVNKLNLQHKVKFYPSSTSPLEVARFMKALDLSLLMTRTTQNVKEQFGRAIIESQACGTPVIGSTCGAISKVIGKGGWVVDERDAQGLAVAIDNAYCNPQMLAKARNAGLMQVDKHFSYASVARALTTAWSFEKVNIFEAA